MTVHDVELEDDDDDCVDGVVASASAEVSDDAFAPRCCLVVVGFIAEALENEKGGRYEGKERGNWGNEQMQGHFIGNR